MTPPVCHLPDATTTAAPLPAALLPGSFNPLHDGHRELAAVAGRRLGLPVHFELSAANVDKPDLSADEVDRRVKQFSGVAPIWVTRAARFAQKVELFPGTAFVVGWDTAARLIDPRYAGGDTAQRDAVLRTLLDRGCRVLVGGRAVGGAFRTWDAAAHGPFAELFDVIPEAEFRVDVSSTELRAAAVTPPTPG